MERILARPAFLVRYLHVCANDAVTDCTFTLPFDCPLDVSSKGNETFNDTACGKDNDLECPQP